MRSTRLPWLLLSPTIIILIFTGLLPFFYVLYVGFFDWNIFSATGEMSYSAANNYRKLVFDQDFLDSLWATILFTFWAVTSEMVLGFFLANTLLRDFRGKAFFRTIHSLPLMVAPIAVGATWRLLTIPGFGPAPYFLDKWFGFAYQIGTFRSHAFITTVLMDIWHWTPFVTLTLLAGLSAMPREPQEQAMVDGANRWQAFTKIILPLTKPAILAVTLFSFTAAWKEFLFAFVFISSDKLLTLPVGLAQTIFGDIYPWGLLMAASLIISVPVVIFYIYGQKYMVAGLTAGSVKG